MWTHDKSISKLDLITVLKVFSCKDTVLLFYCIVRVAYTLNAIVLGTI